MAKFKYLMFIAGFALLFNSCMKPDDAEPAQILFGEWKVINVIVDGQINIPDEAFLENSVLHLELDETFLFINVDGRANIGTWTATETQLTLSHNDGGSTVFNIVYLDYDKLHVYYTVGGPGGEFELRYLFNRIK